MVKKKSIELSEVPEGVKIIGGLYYIGALITLILGSLLLSISDSVRQNADAFVQAGVNIPNSTTLVIAGIALLVISIVEYLLARGIFKLAKWARFTIAFISVLGIVGAVMNLKNGMFAGGIFSLVANGLIIGYLLFCKKTRDLFN